MCIRGVLVPKNIQNKRRHRGQIDIELTPVSFIRNKHLKPTLGHYNSQLHPLGGPKDCGMIHREEKDILISRTPIL